jgi:class 3 adenylate cyclase
MQNANLPPDPAVLFADLAGSTSIYEKLGDAAAKAMIDECLQLMRAATACHGGRVIKTIGDELMCVFPDADRGSMAAVEMQSSVAALAPVSGVRRSIRVGLHAGPLIEAEGDVFGDTVNTAARMTGFAKGDQIITSGATVERMSPVVRSTTRMIAALSVRGKGDDVEVYEVIWSEADDLTTMASASGELPALTGSLHLTHGTRHIVLEGQGARAVIGRDASCQIVLSDKKASRVHARIERRRDKFFLIDQSTNGTFVTFTGENEIALRREELLLRGSGRITFGHREADSREGTVSFTLL